MAGLVGELALTGLWPVALGTSILSSSCGVRQVWVADGRVDILAVVVRPVNSTMGARPMPTAPPDVGAVQSPVALDVDVSIEIVSHDPDHAKVRILEDGSSISDRGISSVQYALLPAVLCVHKFPTHAEVPGGTRRRIVKDGLAYLRVACGEHVVVHVRNRGDRHVEFSAVILCRDADRIASVDECDGISVGVTAANRGAASEGDPELTTREEFDARTQALWASFPADLERLTEQCCDRFYGEAGAYRGLIGDRARWRDLARFLWGLGARPMGEGLDANHGAD